MSLRARLTLLIVLLLGFSLGVATGLAAWQAAQQLRTELNAALLVGVQTVRGDASARDQPSRLAGLVAEFNGDRHLQAVLLGTDGEVLRASTLASGGDPVPAWFARLVGRGPPAVLVRQGAGTVLLRADPANELLEIWGSLRDEVLGFAMLCVPMVVLVYLTVLRALRPLADIAAGLGRIEAGGREVRVPARGPPELAGLARGFNRMSGRLDDVDARNARLAEQMLSLQEEERADLARDLHDEVGPALFAVTMTTATILRLLREAAPDGQAAAMAAPREDAAPHGGSAAARSAREIAGEVRLIQDSIGHVQRHVRDILGRLRPLRAAEFGLPAAVGELAAFWRARPVAADHGRGGAGAASGGGGGGGAVPGGPGEPEQRPAAWPADPGGHRAASRRGRRRHRAGRERHGRAGVRRRAARVGAARVGAGRGRDARAGGRPVGNADGRAGAGGRLAGHGAHPALPGRRAGWRGRPPARRPLPRQRRGRRRAGRRAGVRAGR